MMAKNARSQWKNKGALPLNLIGKYMLVFIGLAIAIGLLVTLFSDPFTENAVNNAGSDSLQTDGPAVCQSIGFQEAVDPREFQQLLFAQHYRNCNVTQTTVRLDFTLTADQLRNMLNNLGITRDGTPYLLFRDDCDMPTGYGGVAVAGEDSGVLYKRHMPVTLTQAEQGTLMCDFSPKTAGESCQQDRACKGDLICGYRNATAVASCSNDVVAAQFNTSLLAFGDSSPLLQCCSSSTRQLFVNAAEELNGKNILVVYETAWKNKQFDPNFTRFSSLGNALRANAFTVDTRRRVNTYQINHSQLDNISQLWLIQPGWCQGNTRSGSPRTQERYCENVTQWSSSELQTIQSFIQQNGSVLLTSSYSEFNGTQHMDQSTPNTILSAVHDTAQFAASGCSCGCDAPSNSQLHDSPVTQGVSQLQIAGATHIELSRVCQQP